MRTATIVAAAIAAGVVGAGAVVTPVVVAANDAPPPNLYGARWDSAGSGGRGFGPMPGHMRDESGRFMGSGLGEGGLRHLGPGPGGCLGDAPSGTLTTEQRRLLAQQAELEKLSHEVYAAFAEDTGDVRFAHIAWSETRHLEAVRTLMDRYDVEDPTKGLAEGKLPAGVLDDYNAYVEDGSTSLRAALDTAAEIEQRDIDGLEAAAEGLDAPDVERVYRHLTQASRMHLAVFSR